MFVNSDLLESKVGRVSAEEYDNYKIATEDPESSHMISEKGPSIMMCGICSRRLATAFIPWRQTSRRRLVFQ